MNDADSQTFVAPGKLILIGEYAVLENAPALVCGIAVYSKAWISKRKGPYSVFRSTNFEQDELRFELRKNECRFINDKSGKTFPFIRSLLTELCHNISENSGPLAIESDTTEFYTQNGLKYGLGSSAAVTVATALAISDFLGLKYSREELLRLTIAAHQKAQQMLGSGIDLAASLYGGIFCFIREAAANTQPRQLKFPDRLRWMPVWTGKSASTADLVRHVNLFKEQNPKKYARIITQMSDIAEKACKYFAQNECAPFLEGINEYYSLMKLLTDDSGIPIISEEHQCLAETAARVGSVYKPSGAGAGDFGIAFFDSVAKEEQFVSELQKTSFRILPLDIDQKGARYQSD